VIKSVAFLHSTASPAGRQKLSSFLAALGFESGPAWQEEASQGALFFVPRGGIELTTGPVPYFAEFAIEVSSLDAAHQASAAWLRDNSVNPDSPSPASLDLESLLTPIADTNWKSSYFTVEPVPGHKFSFWAWDVTRTEPLKGKPIAVEGDLSAAGMKFAIVVARWNAVITDRLLEGALDGLLRSGAKRDDIEIVRVPGAWEVPPAARTIANRSAKGKGSVDAIVTLGCLIRGETAHYEAIYNEVARGIGQSQQETGIPHSFGVLTCETLEQALNRAGIKAGNKGFEAAIAAIEMVSIGRKLENAKTEAQ
jgi:6,7-dimethyl-8-ribityllumazine synthase